MFLYLGDGKYKKLSSLIGIFDMDSATVCVATRRFLSAKEKEGAIESDGELPKSFLLYEKEKKSQKKSKGKNKETVVFLSKLASGVIISRTARIKDEADEEQADIR